MSSPDRDLLMGFRDQHGRCLRCGRSRRRGTKSKDFGVVDGGKPGGEKSNGKGRATK